VCCRNFAGLVIGAEALRKGDKQGGQLTCRPVGREHIFSANNPHVHVENENHMLSAHGLLMPTRKGDAPPDLRHFKI
jgi:hypothetical protein